MTNRGKGRLKESQQALRFLRGWTSSARVEEEFALVVKSSRGARPSTWEKICRAKDRSVYGPFALVSFAFFVSCFNGSVALLVYGVETMARLESPVRPHLADAILLGLQVIAAIALVLIVPRYGIRKPTLFSLAVGGLSNLLVALLVLLRGTNLYQGSSYGWITLVLLSVGVVISTMGIRSTPWILVGEVFPGDIRDLAAGIAGSSCNIYAALASKSFLYLLEWLTLPGVFLLFAVVNFTGWAVLTRTMPETRGKTLADIEKFFADEKAGKPSSTC